jgi:hypothetical protein
VLKSMENSGSQRSKKEILEVYVLQKNYVVNVTTDLNVLNGVSNTKDSASGVDLHPSKETQYVVNVT